MIFFPMGYLYSPNFTNVIRGTTVKGFGCDYWRAFENMVICLFGVFDQRISFRLKHAFCSLSKGVMGKPTLIVPVYFMKVKTPTLTGIVALTKSHYSHNVPLLT